MISSALRAFAVVFPAELPDKTMIASIVLVARFRRPLWVWIGASSAFLVHVVVAVTAGGLLSRLPDAVVAAVVTVLFLVGAVLLLREGLRESTDEPDEADRTDASALTTAAGAFGVVVLAEWGDLTQLATAGLASSGGSPIGTAVGAWLALISVAAIAVTVGRRLIARIPLQRINLVGAAVFGALAVWSAYEFVSALRA